MIFMKDINLKIVVICSLVAFLSGCSSSRERKPLSEREQEFVEEQAQLQWKATRNQLQTDGYGKYDSDGKFLWQKKIKKKKLKILNKRELELEKRRRESAPVNQ
jgi:outer membrane biogenesis lipoprotein LolB